MSKAARVTHTLIPSVASLKKVAERPLDPMILFAASACSRCSLRLYSSNPESGSDFLASIPPLESCGGIWPGRFYCAKVESSQRVTLRILFSVGWLGRDIAQQFLPA